MNACKALLMALCLSLAAGAADDPAPALALPLPAAPRWLHKSANGSLVIRSATRGAQVAVDGRAVGSVPLAPIPIAPGRHEVKISKKGFVSATLRVRVVSGQKALLAIDLKVGVPTAPLPLPPAEVAEAPPSPSDALTALIASPPAHPLAAAPGAPAEVGASAGAAAAARAGSGAAASVALEPLPQPPLVIAPVGPALAPAMKAPSAALAAQSVAQPQPLTKKWWFWGGAAVGVVALAAAVTWALPALYVERRDPAAACGGTCGIVINK